MRLPTRIHHERIASHLFPALDRGELKSGRPRLETTSHHIKQWTSPLTIASPSHESSLTKRSEALNESASAQQAEAMPAEAPPAPTANDNMSLVLCSICCEENKPNLVSLIKCSHKCCTDCLVQWIERVEATAATIEEGEDPAVGSLPGCPFCRVQLTIEETNSILGRSYEPGRGRYNKGEADVPAEGGGAGAEEMDELTLQLLQEQSKQCPRCGAWIEKLEGGCDMMECLCGCRFCYACGAPGARCDCTPATHNFWDNILDRNAGSTPAHEEAPITKEGQVRDLLSHIRNRKKKDQDDQVRIRRAMKRQDKGRECQNIDEVIYSAKWLFLPLTRSATHKMLSQIFKRDRIQGERRQRRNQCAWDEDWYCDELVSSARWLFLPTKGAFKLLEQQSYQSVYYRRQNGRENRSREEMNLTLMESSARWLFCKNPRTTGFRMLQVQRKALYTRHSRAYRRARDQGDDTEQMEPEQVIVSGGWLFRKKTPEETYQHLKRLVRHEKDARRAHEIRFWGSGCTCGSPFCENGRQTAEPDQEIMEKENAVTLRLLFYLTKEDKIRERKEIAKYGL